MQGRVERITSFLKSCRASVPMARMSCMPRAPRLAGLLACSRSFPGQEASVEITWRPGELRNLQFAAAA